jgi:hypothetical protein
MTAFPPPPLEGPAGFDGAAVRERIERVAAPSHDLVQRSSRGVVIAGSVALSAACIATMAVAVSLERRARWARVHAVRTGLGAAFVAVAGGLALRALSMSRGDAVAHAAGAAGRA